MKTNITFGLKTWMLAMAMTLMGFMATAGEVDTTRCIKFVSDSTQEVYIYMIGDEMSTKAKIVFGTDSVKVVDAFFDSYYLEVGEGQEVTVYGAVSEFRTEGGRLRSLEVGGNAGLHTLVCVDCGLTSLDVSRNPNLLTLELMNNELTSLDLSNSVQMEQINVTYNKLTSLDVSHCPRLMALECSANELRSIEFGDERMMIDGFMCSDNQLTSLDLSNVIGLRAMCCNNNQLEHLDLSHNEFLGMLECSNNNLTMLNLSANHALTHLKCDDADFTPEVWDKIFCDLPDASDVDWGARIIFDSVDLLTAVLEANGNNAKMSGWEIVCYSPNGEIDYTDSTMGDYVCGDPAGIEGVEMEMGVGIYPNPSCGEAKIVVKDVEGDVVVNVIDMSGRMVMERVMNGAGEVRIDGLMSGAYVVKVMSGRMMATRRLVVR